MFFGSQIQVHTHTDVELKFKEKQKSLKQVFEKKKKQFPSDISLKLVNFFFAQKTITRSEFPWKPRKQKFLATDFPIFIQLFKTKTENWSIEEFQSKKKNRLFIFAVLNRRFVMKKNQNIYVHCCLCTHYILRGMFLS